VVLIVQGPHGKNGEVNWRSELLQRLQEVRANCKTRNQLTLFGLPLVARGVVEVIRWKRNRFMCYYSMAERCLCQSSHSKEGTC